jgi:hypothetical protein
VAYQLFLTGREIDLPIRQLLGVVVRSATAVLIMLAGLWAMRRLLDERTVSAHLQLPLLVAGGSLCYAAAVTVLRQRLSAFLHFVRR